MSTNTKGELGIFNQQMGEAGEAFIGHFLKSSGVQSLQRPDSIYEAKDGDWVAVEVKVKTKRFPGNNLFAGFGIERSQVEKRMRLFNKKQIRTSIYVIELLPDYKLYKQWLDVLERNEMKTDSFYTNQGSTKMFDVHLFESVPLTEDQVHYLNQLFGSHVEKLKKQQVVIDTMRLHGEIVQ